MTSHLAEPERWAERASGGASAEDRMGAALRRARAATVPSEALVARVEAGVFEHAPAAFPVLRWRQAAFALVALLALGGTVGAARAPLRAWAGRHGLLPPSAATAAPAASPKPPVRVARTTPLAAGEPPAPAVPAPTVAVVAPAASPAAPRAARPRVAQPAGEPPVAEEARLLKDVFRTLRAGAGSAHAGEALAALDEYDRRFPAGLLRDEARLARAEALLALGRREDARALLEAWEAGGGALPRAAREALLRLRAP